MTEPPDITTDLPDLSALPLADLDNPQLAESLRRVTEEDERGGVVAGFQSAI